MWMMEPDSAEREYAKSACRSTHVLASPRMTPLRPLDRLRATARREPVDRPPYAFWRHFPTADRSPAGLAQATLRFHDRYGSDFLALVPPAGYAAQAWGCVESDTVRQDGSRPCASCAVARPEDWRAIRAVDPAAAPGYADVVETVVRVGFDRRIGGAPVVITLPAPSTVAARLGGGRLAAHLREWPGLVGGALTALAETQARFGELCLAEGLAGVLVTVHAPAEAAFGEDVYAEFLEPHDRAVVDALRSRAELLVIHAAGPVAFARVAGWPAGIVSWTPVPDLPHSPRATRAWWARRWAASSRAPSGTTPRDGRGGSSRCTGRRRGARPRRGRRRPRVAGHARRGAGGRHPGPGGVDPTDPRPRPLTSRQPRGQSRPSEEPIEPVHALYPPEDAGHVRLIGAIRRPGMPAPRVGQARRQLGRLEGPEVPRGLAEVPAGGRLDPVEPGPELRDVQ